MANAPYQPTDRRPIAARSWRIWQAAAVWLARRGVSANAISLAGMFCGVAAGAALAATARVAPEQPGALGERAAWLAGGVLVLLRLLANMLDGMVAIEAGTASPVGELYNEAPDRVSDTAVLVGAGYALGGDPTIGWLAACLALFTAYARALGKAAGAPQEFCGPMAKQQRMAVIVAIAAYLALAPAHWRPTWAFAPERGLMAAGLALVALGSALTTLRRLARVARNLSRSNA